MPRSNSRRRHLPACLSALLAIGLLAGCGGPDPRADLVALPALDLSAAQDSAREQLETARATVEAELADSDVDIADLAQSFADLGLLYTTFEYLDAAEISFANARKLAPEDYRWSYLLGYLTGLQGRLAEAVPLYEASLSIQPDYSPALVRLGRVLVELADYDAARQRFDSALAGDPEIAAAHEGLGRIAVAAGDDKAAVEHFGRALALAPSADSLHYALAQSYRNLGELDRARFHLDARGEIPVRVADPLIDPMASLAQSAQFYILQGTEALDQQRHPDAAAAFRAALDQDDSHFQAYRGLSVALQRMGDLAGATETLDQALEQAREDDGSPLGDERRAGVLRALGQIAVLDGRDGEALERYLSALQAAPKSADLLLRTGNALARQGRLDDAVTLYDRLMSVEPAWTPSVLEKRAVAYVNLGRHDEAVADFEHAVGLSPNDARLRRLYASALEAMGRGAAAADARREAAKRTDADDPEVLVEQARDALRQGDRERAVEALEQALALRPDAVETRLFFAGLLAHGGDLDGAIAQYDQVIDAQPRHSDARRDQIVALIIAGRHGEARLRLQEALRLFPRNVALALTQIELLATSPDARVRDGALAVQIAEKVAADHDNPYVRQSLAFAYAAAGRFDDASAIQRALIEGFEAAGASPEVLDTFRQRLVKFEANQPWIAPSPNDIIFSLIAGRDGRPAS
ncbi:MAG: tetratricopeptide repeat protein [Acidobacteriota bacterium]